MSSFFRPTAIAIDTGPVDTGFATMRVTSPFGHRPDPLDTTFRAEGRPQRTVFHGGIDVGNARAGDDVVAIGDGEVSIADNKPHAGFNSPSPADKVALWGPTFGGNMVVIRHPDGRHSQYAHLRDIVVQAGQKVKTADIIGQVGDTGSAKGQAHLHHGIQTPAGRWVDPVRRLQLTGPWEDPAVIAELRTQVDELRTQLVEMKALASRRGDRIAELEARQDELEARRDELKARRDELKAEIVELDQQLATDDSAVVAELRQKLAAIRAMAERDSG
jgi:ribosomal protein L29